MKSKIWRGVPYASLGEMVGSLYCHFHPGDRGLDPRQIVNLLEGLTIEAGVVEAASANRQIEMLQKKPFFSDGTK